MTRTAATAAIALALLAAMSQIAAQDVPALPPPSAAPIVPPTVIRFTADFGYVSTSGNTQVTTLNTGDKLTVERGRWLFAQNFAMVYGRQRDSVSANNLRTALRADYKIDKVFALFVATGFDRNVFAGIEKRFEEILGVQALVLAAARDSIRVEAGGSMTQQLAVGGGQQNFPAARGALSWRHGFTPAAYFQQNAEFIPNLEEHEDWRFNTESAVVAPLSARIGLKLSYVLRVDNLPEPGFTTTDRLFTTGIQLTF